MLRVLVLLAVLSAGVCAQTTLLTVACRSAADRDAVRATGLDVAGAGHELQVLVTRREDVARVAELGLPFEIVTDDLAAWYRDRLLLLPAPDLPPPFGIGSMGGYLTADEMVQVLDGLQAAHPSILAPRVQIGTSIEGRPLWMWKLSDNVAIDENEPEMLLDGGHHAREPMSMHAAVYALWRLCTAFGSDPALTRLVEERELYVVPLVNPDGYVHNQQTAPGGGGLWRKNRRQNGDGSVGVDLNRNYGWNWGFNNFGSSPIGSAETYRGTGPFSEPCAQAMRDFALARDVRTALTLHSFGNGILMPPGHAFGALPAPPIAAAYEALALELRRLSPGWDVSRSWDLTGISNGSTDDWWYGGLYGGQLVLGFAAEIGAGSDGFWPPLSRVTPLCEETFVYVRHLLAAAGPVLHVESSTVSDTGGPVAGAWEPGEALSLDLSLCNAGASSAAATVSVETASPWIQSTGSAVTTSPIAPRACVAVAGMPAVVLAPGAPLGALVSFDIVVASPLAAPIRRTLAQRIGAAPLVVLSDDCEVVQPGWVAGVPGDTAPPTSRWTVADPLPTTSPAIFVWNPGDDHSPAPGAGCWFTGQGSPGGSWSEADVDGTTTLLSPLFDASDADAATVSFRRWTATSGADPFEVAISNDGGLTWRIVEIVTRTQNAWLQVRFPVESFLPRTNRMRLRFRVADDPNDSATEAAIDDLAVTGFDPLLRLSAPASPVQGTPFAISLSAPRLPLAAYLIGIAAGASSGFPAGGALVPLDPDALFLYAFTDPLTFAGFSGVLDAGGAATAQIAMPAAPSLSGASFVLAAAATTPSGGISITGATWVTIP